MTDFREQVAQAAWEQGVGTFFYEGVPFSFSTGTAFGGGIARFLAASYPDRHRPLRIEELGAGLGMLSVHMLDILSLENPALFDWTTVQVTEFSQRVISELSAWGVFERFGSKVHIGEADCRALGKTVDVVLMAYVLDALPALHLRYGSEGWQMRQVTPVVSEKQWVLDGRVFPPSPVLARTCMSQLSAGRGEEAALLRQIWPHVCEEVSWVPLGAQLSAADMQILGRLQREGCTQLGFPIGLSALLESLEARLSVEGMVIIYDAGGTPVSPDNADLETRYGLTVCHLVPFSAIVVWAEARGLCCRVTAYPFGNSQMLVLSRQPLSQGAWETLVGLVAAFSHQKYAQVIHRIREVEADVLSAVIPVSGETSFADWLIQEGAPADMAEDYSVVMHTAVRCMDLGLFAQAQALTGMLLGRHHKKRLGYAVVGASAWLLYGKASKALGALSEAVYAFQEAARIAPYDEYVWYERAVLALAQKAYADYVTYAKQYLRYRCRMSEVWETTVTVLMCMAMLGEKEAVLAAGNQVLGYQDHVPESVSGKIKQLLALVEGGSCA